MTTNSLMPCLPAFQTTPTPDLPTIGRDTIQTARLFGHKLIPWQVDVVNAAGMMVNGGWRYRYIVLIVPRRAGKTLTMLAHALTVARLNANRRVFYASHRRETAAALWRDDWFPMLEQSPLYPRFTLIRRANGSEAITWKPTKSVLRLLPPRGDAIRSFRSDVAMIDEAREFSHEQGSEIEGAVLPTSATGQGGQMWIVSNAGDDTSHWLKRWRNLGRDSVIDPDSPIYYVEFAAPDGADPADPKTWAQAHPGFGFHVNADVLAADQAVMSEDTFAAEYLGVWPQTLRDDALIDGWANGLDWSAAVDEPFCIAVDIDLDRKMCSIVASDGAVVELIEHRPHGEWVKPRLDALVATHRPLAVVWDGAGPANSLERELQDVAAMAIPMRTRDVTSAAGAFHDAAASGLIRHRDPVEITAAVAQARRRTTSGSWVYDRRVPGSGPLVAATLARWAALNPDLRAGQIW